MRLLQNLRADLLHALRLFRRQSLFAGIVIGSLAIGIAAMSGIGTAYDNLLYRRLPVRDAAALVLFTAVTDRQDHARTQTFSYADYLSLRASLNTQASIAGIETVGQQPVRNESGTSNANLALVSPEYFAVFLAAPRIGSLLRPQDANRAVAVVSERYWRAHLGGNPAVLGKTIVAGGIPFVIIGVAPRGFVGDDLSAPVDIWLPIASAQPIAGPGVPANDAQVRVIGALKPGISRQASQAECEAVYSALLRTQAGSLAARMHSRLQLLSDSTGIVSQRESTSRILSALTALAALLLVASCANAALLLSSHAESRRPEIATRFALGATRRRIVAHLLSAHFLLFLLAAGLGMLLAWGASTGLVAVLGPQALPSAALFSSDSRFSPAALVVCALLAVLFGVASALMLSRSASAKVSELQTARVTRVSLLAYGVLACQVALAVALVSSALVCLRTVTNLLHVDLGFERRNLLIAETLPSRSGLKGAKLAQIYSEIQASLASAPGIHSATVSATAPLASGPLASVIRIPGFSAAGQQVQIVRRNLVGPEFFKTLRIPLLYGRVFNADDNSQAQHVAVISQSMARHYFGSASALGRTIFLAAGQEPIVVVGVVRDVKLSSPYDESPEMMYLLMLQQTRWLTHDMYIEARVDSAAAANLIRAKIEAIAPGVDVSWIDTANERLNSLLVTERLSAGLALAFSVLSVALACIGIYAVTSLAVERRTVEIGIRMALGASQRGVVSFILRRTLSFVLIGVAFGIPAALAGGRFLADQITGLTPIGPALLAIACLCAFALCAGAASVPALRAAWIDPLRSLRSE